MRFRDLLLVLGVVLLMVCPLIYIVSLQLMLFCMAMVFVSIFAWGCCEAIEQTKNEKNFSKRVDKSILV
jgi:uncharacterized membrane protein YhaH (DUF805 family)